MMRSIAEQNVAELGGGWSVLGRQKRDHVKLYRLLDRLGELAEDEQGPILLQVYRLVFPHAFAEEAVLWPALRRLLPDGQALTLQVEREHQAINALMARLEALQPGSPDRAQLLERVVDLLRADVRDEEDKLLPRLQGKASVTQLRLLGIAWEGARQIAPTRAHPLVARRPPGNMISALPLAIIDRCRDVIDSLLHRYPGVAAPVLRGLGSALTGAARAVEGLPGMRSGEDPQTRMRRPGGVRWGAAALLAVGAASAGVAFARRRP